MPAKKVREPLVWYVLKVNVNSREELATVSELRP
jgi:hypothetical protein